MDEFISKPFLTRMLYSVSYFCLKEQGLLVSASQISRGMDVSVLAELIGSNDPAKLQRLAKLFLLNAGRAIDEMFQALASDQHEEIGVLAHRVKSSALTVGAREFAAICEVLENKTAAHSREELGELIEQLSALMLRITQEVSALAQGGGA